MTDDELQVASVKECSAHPPRLADGTLRVLKAEWRTPEVIALAKAIDECTVTATHPILADALEEAGCADVAVLLHCRACESHDPDCWVVAFALDKLPIDSPTITIDATSPFEEFAVPPVQPNTRPMALAGAREPRRLWPAFGLAVFLAVAVRLLSTFNSSPPRELPRTDYQATGQSRKESAEALKDLEKSLKKLTEDMEKMKKLAHTPPLGGAGSASTTDLDLRPEKAKPPTYDYLRGGPATERFPWQPIDIRPVREVAPMPKLVTGQ